MLPVRNAALAAPLLFAAVPSAAPRAPRADDSLGFTGPRIVRLDDGTHSPRAGDFDSDGLTDLAVVNNAKARIELLLQRRPGALDPAAPEDVNVPADDPLFEKRSLVTEKRVGGFVAGDFNGDGKHDLAWYGNPRALVVAYQGARGSFERRRVYDVSDGSESTGALAAGDVNGDGKLDAVLLAENDVVALLQEADGLGEPKRIASSLKDVAELRVADFDGDKRDDLLLISGNDPAPLRFRFQRADGTIGPEVAFPSTPLRSVAAMPAEKGHDLLVVAQASGTLRRLRLKPDAGIQGAVELGRPRLFAFGEGKGARRRSAATGDVDGDGRADLLVTDPAGARVLLYRQTASGELAGPETFPCYRDATQAVIADLDGDRKRNEVAVMSGEEKAVGWMAWEEGRLTFPRNVAIGGAPLALDAADVDGDGATDLVAAVKQDKETRIAVRYGSVKGPGEAAVETPLPGAGDVGGVRVADFDRDGASDVLVLSAFDDLRVLRGTAGRAFSEIPAKELLGGTSLKGLTTGSTAIADLDGDGKRECLFAAKNYVRAVAIPKPGSPVAILDQINARADSDVAAAAAADLDGDGKVEAVLLDKASKSLLIQRRNEQGVFETARTLEVGAFEFAGLLADDLTGDGRKDLVILGLEKVGVVPAGKVDLAPAEVDAYESRERKAYLFAPAVADLGGRPGREVIVLDGAGHAVEVLAAGDGGWERLVRWQVFEEKSFEARGGGPSEPHGATVADLTGDGKPDLVLLAHDRVLVYPRE